MRRVTAHALIRMSQILGIHVSLQWHEILQDDTTKILTRKVTVNMTSLFRIFVDLIHRKARVVQKETSSSSLDYLLQHRSRAKSDLGVILGGRSLTVVTFFVLVDPSKWPVWKCSPIGDIPCMAKRKYIPPILMPICYSDKLFIS